MTIGGNVDFWTNEWDLPTQNDYSQGTTCLEEVVVDLTVALRHDPNNADAYLERGNVYFAEDEWDLAIADYTAAIRLDAELAAAYYFRGLAHQHKGDLDRGKADQAMAAFLDPALES
jgi:tetratricopeptide (TPR) repeat protein